MDAGWRPAGRSRYSIAVADHEWNFVINTMS